MSKLPERFQFLDLSDYGRPVAKLIAISLKNTRVTSIHITFCFLVAGLLSIYFILTKIYSAAFFFLIVKSVLDAADGELARVKNEQSYTGRYLDSLFDIILNLLIFLSICYITSGSFILMTFAFICFQLQGTLYNYYYLILRKMHDGDNTSRIYEHKAPRALKGEKQKHVDILFTLYKMTYGIFDKIILTLDPNAVISKNFPKWFMTVVSIFGLGFQLLIIGVMLYLGYVDYVIPFFIYYSIFIIIIIYIRKTLDPAR